MESGDYRLAALLDLRRREQEAREQALATALAGAARARELLEEAHGRLADLRLRETDNARRSAARATAGDASAGDLAASVRYAARLVERSRATLAQVREAESAVLAADRVVVAARDALADSVRAHEAVGQHQEGWLKDRQREVDRREELHASDLANSRNK